MSNQSQKPTHHLVRYYGSGRNSDSARLGATWTKNDGSLYIRLYTPSEIIEPLSKMARTPSKKKRHYL